MVRNHKCQDLPIIECFKTRGFPELGQIWQKIKAQMQYKLNWKKINWILLGVV